jgi:hypothetical protein
VTNGSFDERWVTCGRSIPPAPIRYLSKTLVHGRDANMPRRVWAMIEPESEMKISGEIAAAVASFSRGAECFPDNPFLGFTWVVPDRLRAPSPVPRG